jgi:NAD(P)-dependent dehydrogenase (short-subunit alcohol dehydrogenase family)
MGRAVSALFAKEGASVTIAERNEETGAETVQAITEGGGKAVLIPTDVSISQSVQEMVQRTVDTFGKVDILYNNAARLKPNPPVSEAVAEMSEEHWNAVININLSGYYLCAKYAIPRMIEGGGGVIINVSSTAAFAAGGNYAAYSTSKAGILALTRSMAIDYAANGIRVVAICPGPIDTPRFRGTPDPKFGSGEDRVRNRGKQVPLGRVGTPEDIAKAALFLVSDDASFITGTHLLVDGGSLLRSG